MKILTLFLILILSVVASAQSSTRSRLQGLLISADSSSRDMENDTVELDGNIQIIYKDQHLKADHARIDLKSKTLDAYGGVLVTGPESTYGGARIRIDYETNTGIIVDGFVQSGSVFVQGELLQKVGEKEFIANKAQYSTCDNCPETWAFSGTRVRAELGGYAYIKNAVMRVGNIPFFWLPYLVVPLKSDRQTGLLTPELENTGSGGLTFTQPFFWAISKSQDATLIFMNYEKRGQKILTNYRYILSPTSYGSFDGAFIRDKVFPNNDNYKTFHGENTGPIPRWFVKYQHYYDLPDGFTQRAQLHTASDLLYPADFTAETKSNGDAAMENRMSITKNTKDQSYTIDSSYYVNLLQSNPLASNNGAVHRMPEFRFSQNLQRIGTSEFLYNIDANFTNFARSGYSYDEINKPFALGPDQKPVQRHLNSTGPIPECATDKWEQKRECYYKQTGKYDPQKDIIRAGQRLDAQLIVSRPITVGKFDILPSVGYRETQYSFPIGDQTYNYRRYLRTEVSMRTTFGSIFGDEKADSEGNFTKYKHEIEPEFTATGIPWISQPPHPFYGGDYTGTTPKLYSSADIPYSIQGNISADDLNNPYGLQFDYNDRLYERKLFRVALINKWVQKKWTKGKEATYSQIVGWKLSQSYDIFQAESDFANKQPYSDILSELAVSLDKITVYQLADYFPYQRATNFSTALRYFNSRGEYVTLGHNLTHEITQGQAVDPTQRTEEIVFGLRKDLRPFDIIGIVKYGINSKDGVDNNRVKTFAYAIQSQLPGSCWYITFLNYKTTQEFGAKVTFDFSFDGKPNRSLPENVLANYL